MKAVFQTKLTPPSGNCWAACVASVLELSIEDVPDIEFKQLEKHNTPDVKKFWRVWGKWLATRNLQHLSVTAPKGVPFPKGYILVCGVSPRGKWLHSVVYRDGKLCHDPFPEGGGIKKIITIAPLN